jgi:hypothetical protein
MAILTRICNIVIALNLHHRRRNVHLRKRIGLLPLRQKPTQLYPVLEKHQSTHHQRDPETQYDHRNARNSDADDARFLGVDATAAK